MAAHQAGAGRQAAGEIEGAGREPAGGASAGAGAEIAGAGAEIAGAAGGQRWGALLAGQAARQGERGAGYVQLLGPNGFDPVPRRVMRVIVFTPAAPPLESTFTCRLSVLAPIRTVSSCVPAVSERLPYT